MRVVERATMVAFGQRVSVKAGWAAAVAGAVAVEGSNAVVTRLVIG